MTNKQQAEYKAYKLAEEGYDQPAAVIDPPRIIKALSDSGLSDYHVWGWVKKSAKFIYHVGVLKGSKLSTWDVIALSINEGGECDLSAPEIAKLTRYSVSETRQAIKELDELGYLSVVRNSGKRSIYKPVFAARGAKIPSEIDPSTQTTPLVGKVKRADDPSSLSIENSVPTSKELKELKGANALSAKDLEQVNAKVNYILATNDPAKAWQGRELIRADLLEYADWYHGVTGQVMTKRVQAAWWKALPEWKAEGLTIASLQAAYDSRVAWAKIIKSPLELTADAVAIQSLPPTKKKDESRPIYGVITT